MVDRYGRYVRYVDVEVKVTGTSRHRDLVEECFGEMGWQVLVRPPRGTFSFAHRESEGLYVLGIRVRDVPRRLVGKLAERAILDLADSRDLPLEVTETFPQGKSRLQVPVWHVAPPRITVGPWYYRWYFNTNRALGLRDTGRTIGDSHASALSKAHPYGVRAPFFRSDSRHDGTPRRIVDSDERNLRWMSLAAICLALCGTWSKSAGWSLVVTLPLLAFWVLTSFVVRVVMTTEGPSSRLLTRSVGLTISFAYYCGGWILSCFLPVSVLFSTGALMVALILVVRGMGLLGRIWTGKGIVFALLLSFVPVFLQPLLGMGTALHWFYGAEFNVPMGGMEISDAGRSVASIYALVVLVSLTLVALASWGYIRHYFPLVPKPLTSICAFTVVAGVALVGLLVFAESATSGARQAQVDWAHHRVPRGYFGIYVEPVCIVPQVVPQEIMVGATLEYAKVYAYFGVVGDSVTLWDPESKRGFTVKSSAVRIVPVGFRRPGDPIPRSCPTFEAAR